MGRTSKNGNASPRDKEVATTLDRAELVGRRILSCVSEDPNLIATVEVDLGPDFVLGDHRRLWQAAVQLHAEGLPLDVGPWARRAKVDPSEIGLLFGDARPELFKRYVEELRRLARDHRKARLLAELPNASDPRQLEIAVALQEILSSETDAGGIRHFGDIPDILQLDIPPADCLVPTLGIVRGTVGQYSGEDGDGKTRVLLAMSVAVARGSEFLGMRCQQCPVLYIDLDNPVETVQANLRTILGDQDVPNLKVWGLWNEQEPPHYCDPRLLAICKESRPLLVVDTLRDFHDGDENDSTAMAAVMKYLRRCAAFGAAVIVVHHLARAEGSTGRGSTAIRGKCDLSFVHKLDKKSNLIELRIVKNRRGERRTYTIKPDFEECRFELSESTWLTHRNDELEQLHEIIRQTPGISVNQIVSAAKKSKTHVGNLLDEGTPTWWTCKPGPRKSKHFYSAGALVTGSLLKEREPVDQSENARSGSENQSEPVGTSSDSNAHVVPGTGGNGWELGTSQDPTVSSGGMHL